jgi:hypothetical protein
MNPTSKCAQRLLTALAAIASILFMAACGSSNSVTINPGGFSNSSLKGTYVFSTSGSDSSFGGFFAVAGALVADGTGKITGGTMDVVGIDILPLPSPVAQAITSGSYNITADGRGRATLAVPLGTIVLDLVLTSGSHGLVTEFDNNGTGSGTIDLQTAVTSLSQLAGPYAFSLGGSDSNFNPFAGTGAFALNSTGTTTGGVEDLNDAGITYTGEALSAVATLGSGTGPGAITLTTASFGLTFDFYPVDSTHWKIIETDAKEFLAGDVFNQSNTLIPGNMVFTMAGGTNSTGPIANGGFLTYNGTGFFSGLEDVNQNGTISSAQVPFNGTASIAPFPFGGRTTVNLTGFTPAMTWVVYPSTGGLLMLEMDSTTVTLGAAFGQTPGAALAASQGYGFNLGAFNTSLFLEEDDIAQFNTTSTGFNGIVDINDDSNLSFGRQFIGNYTLDSPATGRGEATTTESNSGFVSFWFYAVDNSTLLLVEADTNQIGTGIFETQNASAAVARSRISLVHPAARSRGATRRK